MAIELMMVISMAMASEVVIIVFLSLAVGWGVKKMNFLKIRLKGKKMNFFCVVEKKLNCCFFFLNGPGSTGNRGTMVTLKPRLL